MNTNQLNEVWAMLDRNHLAEVARRGPEAIFATMARTCMGLRHRTATWTSAVHSCCLREQCSASMHQMRPSRSKTSPPSTWIR